MSEALTSASAFTANLGARERSFWRFLLTLVLGVAVFLAATFFTIVAVIILYIPLFGWPAPTAAHGAGPLWRHLLELLSSNGRRFDSAVQIIGLGVTSNVIPFFAFIGVAAAISGRSLRGLCTAAARFRWRLLLAGFVLASIIVGPLMLAEQWLDPKAAPPPLLSVSAAPGPRLAYLGICVAAFLPAAMGEEILFRGWLLRQMSNVTRRWAPLMVFNGVIFAAAHFDFAPEAFLERWIMGAGFVYMTLRLGGVELSSGVHFSNNILIVLFIEPLKLRPSPNTGIDPAALAASIGLFIGYIAVAEIVCRWRPLSEWAGARLVAAPSPWRAWPSF